jgi:two-component system chemotaxis response regulator CheB
MVRGCWMEAVPHDVSDGARHITGLVCPDCYGVLQVETLGRDHLQFICRIGHTYSLAELLVLKEADLEHRVWSAVLAGEEMAALMGDLLRDGRANPDRHDEVRARQQSAQRLAERIRAALREDRPLRLDADAEGSGVSNTPDGHDQ